MKTLLQITSEVNMGSVGRIAEEIGQLAIQNGWHSYIAYGRNENSSQSNLIKIGTSFDIKIHGVQTRLFDRHGLASRNSTKRLIEQIKVVNPDVIHLHILHGYYINIKVFFNYLANTNIPVVWTLHDCWPFTGHCAYFDYINCKKWKSGCFNCPLKRDYPASLLIDRSRKNYYLKKTLFNSIENMQIVTVSKWLKNMVAESFLNNISTQVIYNGIDINVFTPTIYEDTRKKYSIEEKFVILGVANVWSFRKGFSDFIELSKHLSSNDIIILVGLSTNQIKQLPNNIIGLTKTEDQQELVDLYAAADLFLNLSAEETFGLTTTEALSCGTPAVVYNATAIPEVVDFDTGIIIQKNNINGLIDAIEIVRKKGKDFYSTACRTRVVKYFNKNDRYSEYIDLYKKMIISNI